MLQLDKLNNVRTEHAAIVDKYNGMPLPSLEALGKELCTNRWLCAVVHRVVQYDGMGFKGCLCATPDSFNDHYLRNLEYNDLVAVVPYLRRLGYAVTLFPDEEQSHPFNVGFLDQPRRYLVDLHEGFLEHVDQGGTYPIRMHGTSPAQIRGRGLLKCVPRLLGWLRQARIVLADPRRSGAMDALEAERGEELADTTPPQWETAATEQSRRKRKLVDAIHADEDDVANGARWANINAHGKAKLCRTTGAPFVRPMRIEAIADDHFIFQRCEHDNYYDVVVLHRDAFDVAPRPKQWFHAEGYEERFDNRFCSTGESDEDEDEDEEGGP